MQVLVPLPTFRPLSLPPTSRVSHTDSWKRANIPQSSSCPSTHFLRLTNQPSAGQNGFLHSFHNHISASSQQQIMPPKKRARDEDSGSVSFSLTSFRPEEVSAFDSFESILEELKKDGHPAAEQIAKYTYIITQTRDAYHKQPPSAPRITRGGHFSPQQPRSQMTL